MIEQTQKKKKMLSGVVVSDRMKDTVAVLVTRYVKHTKYGKYIRRGKKYLVHDAGNKRHVGEKVKIQECRPLSKKKSFIMVQESI